MTAQPSEKAAPNAVLLANAGEAVVALSRRLAAEQRLVDELVTWVKRNKSGNRSWEDRMADALLAKVEERRG